MSPTPEAELVIAVPDLIRMATQLARANKQAKRDSATLSFDGQALQIEISGMRLSAAARGTWTARVRVDAVFVRTLRDLKPSTEDVTIRLAGNVITLDDFSLPCERIESTSEPVRVPLTLTPAQILAQAGDKKAADVEHSGLGALVAAAAAKREESIERAFRHLVEYGVTRADLKELVDRRQQGSRKP